MRMWMAAVAAVAVGCSAGESTEESGDLSPAADVAAEAETIYCDPDWVGGDEAAASSEGDFSEGGDGEFEPWEGPLSSLCKHYGVPWLVERTAIETVLYDGSGEQPATFDITLLELDLFESQGSEAAASRAVCAAGAYWDPATPLPNGLPCRRGPLWPSEELPERFWTLIQDVDFIYNPCANYGYPETTPFGIVIYEKDGKLYAWGSLDGEPILDDATGFDEAVTATRNKLLTLGPEGFSGTSDCAVFDWALAGDERCLDDSDCADAELDVSPCERKACVDFLCAVAANPDADGSPCVHEDPCGLEGQCASGLCEASDFLLCDDSDPCTDDLCVDGGCVYAPSRGGRCDDGDACTATDTCVSGLCIGSPSECPCRAAADCPRYEGPQDGAAYACGASGTCVLVGGR